MLCNVIIKSWGGFHKAMYTLRWKFELCAHLFSHNFTIICQHAFPLLWNRPLDYKNHARISHRKLSTWFPTRDIFQGKFFQVKSIWLKFRSRSKNYFVKKLFALKKELSFWLHRDSAVTNKYQKSLPNFSPLFTCLRNK
jgi:hypothetical protein